MDNQLFMLQLQQSPTVWRIAHTHAYTSHYYTGEKNYFAEAFAAINKAGSRVYFGSNWGDLAPDYTDTYQAVLPSSWHTLAPVSTPIATSTPTPSIADGPENTAPLSNDVFLIMSVVIITAAVVILGLRRRGIRRPPSSHQRLCSQADETEEKA
jgi:hypothetical protein